MCIRDRSHGHRARLRAGRALVRLYDGALPGTWLVQTARSHRIAGRNSADFIWRTDDQNLADCGMGRRRLRRDVAGEPRFALLEKRFSAPD